MAFRRTVATPALPSGDALTTALAAVGMGVAGAAAAEGSPAAATTEVQEAPLDARGGGDRERAAEDVNIEDTLLSASVEGLERDDLRVLAVLVTWLRVHHRWVNADRLHRAVLALDAKTHPRVRAFWAAAGAWLTRDYRDRRFARFAGSYEGPRLDLLGSGTEFHLARAGEDPRFAGGPLRVPANVLRDRDRDVQPPAALAARHLTYRRRVLMGPTYRADMWAALDGDPSLRPAALARRAYGSFATAWQVKHDRALLEPAAAAGQRLSGTRTQKAQQAE